MTAGASGRRAELASRLRLMVITRPDPACGRPLAHVARECAAAGATAIQLRDKEADGRELFHQARLLLEALRGSGVLLLVNDRVDIALAAGADGAHLGPDDLPLEAARRVCPPDFLLGYSTDDLEEARGAAAAGADYLGVGSVYGTASKAGLEEEAIGPARVGEVLAAARLPGVGIGGIGPANAAPVARTGAGIAVLSAVMDAAAPGEAVRQLLEAIGSTHG